MGQWKSQGKCENIFNKSKTQCYQRRIQLKQCLEKFIALNVCIRKKKGFKLVSSVTTLKNWQRKAKWAKITMKTKQKSV